MKDKFPEIFKNKVDKIKSKVQKEFYYHNSDESNTDKREVKIDKMTLLKKIESIYFQSLSWGDKHGSYRRIG